ncbi:MAG: hypothetical protein ACI8RO_002145 [Flavobacteriales bacterium]
MINSCMAFSFCCVTPFYRIRAIGNSVGAYLGGKTIVKSIEYAPFRA